VRTIGKLSKQIFPNLRGYLLAIGLVALATWLKLLAQPSIIPADVAILYMLAIAPTTVFFGLGPSIVACILSLLAYDFFFIPPLNQLTILDITSIKNAPILMIFLLVGLLFSYLASNLRKKNAEAVKEIAARKQSQEELAKYRDHLEDLVKQRTTDLEKINLNLEQDIIERKKAEEELKLDADILNNTTDSILVHDLDGNMIFVNETACKSLGYTREELVSLKPYRLSSQEDAERFRGRMNKLLEKKSTIEEVTFLCKDGTTLPVELHGRVIRLGSKELILTVVRDITERKKAEEDLKMRSLLLDSATDSIIAHDLEGNPVYVNEAACRLFGYTREEIMNINFHRLHANSSTVYESKEQVILRTIEDKGSITFETTNVRKGGSSVPVEVHDRLIESGGKKLIIGVITDITERKKIEEHIRQLAYHDPLTGLPNRSLLTDRFNLAQAHAKRYRHLLALMMMDLDKLKDVNDTLGHSAGDRLLKEVGRRLVGCVRKTDTVSRVGGDEFIVLLTETNGEEDASNVARKIMEVMRKPFMLLDHELNVTTSIGIAFYPNDGDDMDIMVKHADSAMYRVKEQGRNGFLHYTKILDTTRAT
jgi:diguanylate cyclase (GGDEF)-like protein/PAS domain S-box-containing protein